MKYLFLSYWSYLVSGNRRSTQSNHPHTIWIHPNTNLSPCHPVYDKKWAYWVSLVWSHVCLNDLARAMPGRTKCNCMTLSYLNCATTAQQRYQQTLIWNHQVGAWNFPPSWFAMDTSALSISKMLINCRDLFFQEDKAFQAALISFALYDSSSQLTLKDITLNNCRFPYEYRFVIQVYISID